MATVEGLMADRPSVAGPFIAVGPAGQPGPYLQLRVPETDGQDLRDLIEAENIAGPPVVMAAVDVSDIAMLLGSTAGGLGGLAAVITAYVRRRDGQRVSLIYGDVTIELSGLTQVERAVEIERALEFAHRRQIASSKMYAELNIDQLPWPPAVTQVPFSENTSPAPQAASDVSALEREALPRYGADAGMPDGDPSRVDVRRAPVDDRLSDMLANTRATDDQIVILPSRLKLDGVYYSLDDIELFKRMRARGADVTLTNDDPIVLHEYAAGYVNEIVIGAAAGLATNAISAIALAIRMRARSLHAQGTHDGSVGTVPLTVSVVCQPGTPGQEPVLSVQFSGEAADVVAAIPQILGELSVTTAIAPSARTSFPPVAPPRVGGSATPATPTTPPPTTPPLTTPPLTTPPPTTPPPTTPPPTTPPPTTPPPTTPPPTTPPPPLPPPPGGGGTSVS